MGITAILLFVGHYIYTKWDASEYPWLTHEQPLAEKIIKVKPYQSIVRIELVNGEKYKLINARNYAYEPYSLHEFISVSDSILKKANSVKRGSEHFVFELTKDLNKSLRTDI